MIVQTVQNGRFFNLMSKMVDDLALYEGEAQMKVFGTQRKR